MFANHALFLFEVPKDNPHGELRFPADVFERHEASVAHAFRAFRIVMEGNPLRRHDFVERNMILIVAPVGPMHHEAPGTAGSQIEHLRRDRESRRPPPIAQVIGMGPRFENKVARGIEQTRGHH